MLILPAYSNKKVIKGLVPSLTSNSEICFSNNLIRKVCMHGGVRATN
ncbi:MAG: hypothetical protein H6Q69_179 [Firmicutes bacterium]|nr:hypothetical protein [Bacillota bacterium]